MTKAEIIHKISQRKAYLQKQFDIVKIGLFGSYAKETQHANSDVDLIFELKQDATMGLAERYDLEIFFKELFQVAKVDLVNRKYINPLIEYNIENTVIYV